MRRPRPGLPGQPARKTSNSSLLGGVVPPRMAMGAAAARNSQLLSFRSRAADKKLKEGLTR